MLLSQNIIKDDNPDLRRVSVPVELPLSEEDKNTLLSMYEYLENGYDDEVLKYAKKFNIPVICITADAIEGAEEKYLSLGYNYYISKPYTVKDFYNVLENIFRK